MNYSRECIGSVRQIVFKAALHKAALRPGSIQEPHRPRSTPEWNAAHRVPATAVESTSSVAGHVTADSVGFPNQGMTRDPGAP